MNVQLVKDGRLKNSKRNVISGVAKQIAGIVLTFLIRTAVIYYLGSQYQGLNSLFNSILQVLNLADLGFASAVTYILYKPIADNDEETICAILSFLKNVYSLIGIIVLVLGVAVSAFLPFFISGDYPRDINIYIVFYIYLLNSSFSYVLFAYKSTLLTALQKDNIVSNVYTFTNILIKLSQLVILVSFRNFYAYALALPVGAIINNLLIQYFSKKYFPSLLPKGRIAPNIKLELKKQVKAIFINRISDVARNSFDSIIVSTFLGLTIVTAYDNYYYILSAILGFMGIVIHSIRASVGNSIIKEPVRKNFNDMLTFSFMFMWVSGFCTVCLACLYQPFMAIWMSNNEKLIFPAHTMCLFCLYFYAYCMVYTKNIYLEAKGLFWECRFLYVIEALANLGLNIFLGYFFNVDGILLATIITIILFNFLPGTFVLFRYYFIIGIKRFFTRHFIYLFITIANCILTLCICAWIPSVGIFGFLAKLLVCIFVPNAFFTLAYAWTEEFRRSIKIVKTTLRKGS